MGWQMRGLPDGAKKCACVIWMRKTMTPNTKIFTDLLRKPRISYRFGGGIRRGP